MGLLEKVQYLSFRLPRSDHCVGSAIAGDSNIITTPELIWLNGRQQPMQRRRCEVVAEGHAVVVLCSCRCWKHWGYIVDWLAHFASSHLPIVRRKASARWVAVEKATANQ